MPEVLIARDDGELGTIDEAELERAQASGFRVVDETEAKAIEKRRAAQSTAGMAIGTGEAVARGVLMGGYDPLARAAGADMEAVAARKENLGTFGAGAELAGSVAPSLLTGGTGALGSVARLTPAGLVARAGTAVERSVAGSALGGRVLGSAAQGAVEGLASGAGAELSRQALADQDLNVERAIAGGVEGFGIGALLGGGLGAAGRGLELGAQGAGRLGRAGLEGAQGLTRRADGALPDLSPSENAYARMGRFLARVQGRDPDTYARLYGNLGSRQGRERILADIEDVRVAAARDIKAAADRANEAAEEGIRVASGASKQARIEQLLAPMDQPGLKGPGGRFVRRPRSHAVGHLESHEQRLRDELEDPLLSRETFSDLSEALRLNETAMRDVRQVRNAAQAYRAIDDYKRSVDAIARRRYDQYLNNRSPEAFRAWQRARSFSDESRAHLESVDLYGGAAVAQRRINAAKSADMAAQENLPPQLRAFLERGAEADTATALSLARGATRYGGETRQDAFQAALDARVNFLRTVRDEFELDPAQLQTIDAAEQAIADMRVRLNDLSETAEVSDDLMRARRDEGGGSPSLTLLSTIGPAGGAGIGLALGGLPGAILGSAAGLVMRPFTLARGLASAGNMLERFRFGTESVASREASIVAGFEQLAEGGRAAVRTSARAARRRAVWGEPETRPQRQARLLAVRVAVMAAAADPLELATQMEGGVAELHDFAPEVARGIVERSAVAVTFLASKVPDVYEPAFGNGKPIVAPEELDRFERYVDAVQDPLGAVEKVMTGSLSLEHAEALRVVYPKIYAEMQSKALEMLGRRKQEGRRISDESLVQLGLMLDMPLTDSLRPGFLSSLQGPVPPAPGAGPAQAPAAPRTPKPIEVTARRTALGRLEAGELPS